MLTLIHLLIQGIQLFLIPICFIGAWTLILVLAWSLWTAARDSFTIAKQMHQIPCTSCQFFTSDYRLKCTVHPSIANTEAAIDCSDFQPKTNPHLY
jgi:hypothetical protein